MFDPALSVLAPKCPVRLLTGYSCPACGIQRAIHAALHGQFRQALGYNYFFTVSVPFLIAVVAEKWLLPQRWRQKARRIVEGKTVCYVYVALFFLWWILRNVLGI